MVYDRTCDAMTNIDFSCYIMFSSSTTKDTWTVEEPSDLQVFLRRSEQRDEVLTNALIQISQTLTLIHKDMSSYQQKSMSQSTQIIDLLSKMTNSSNVADRLDSEVKTPQKLRSGTSTLYSEKPRETSTGKIQEKITEITLSRMKQQPSRTSIVHRQQAHERLPISNQLIWSSQVRRWIGCTYESILNEAFSEFDSGRLEFREVKVMASGRLLSNYHDFLRRSANLEQYHLDIYVEASKSALNFYLNKYPLKEKLVEITQHFEEMDLLEDPLLGVIAQTHCYFVYNSKENYYKSIKQFLNELVKHSSSNFHGFKSLMEKVFQGISYVKTQRRLNQRTPLFTASEMKEKGFAIREQSMIKVVLQWIEELEEVFEKTQKVIKKNFLNRSSHSSSKLEPSVGSKFARSLSQCKSFKHSYFQIIKQASSKIYQYVQINGKHFEYLPFSEVVCGLSSHFISGVMSEVIISYLNKLIASIQESFLLACSQQTEDCVHLAQDLELITFTLSDLFRAQSSRMSEAQIKEVLKRLEDLDNSGDIKIVRITNQLSTVKRDLIVNIKLTGCPLICQVNLQVGQNICSSRENHLDKFNSFISELANSKYGPFACAAQIYTLNSKLDNYFSQRLSSFKKIRNKGIVQTITCEEKGQVTVSGFKRFYQSIFLCTNCLEVSSALNSSTPSFRNGQILLCNACIFDLLTPEQRVVYCLGKDYAQFFEETSELRPFMCAVERDSQMEMTFYSSQSLGKYYELWTDTFIVRENSFFKKSICFGMKSEIKYIRVSLEKAKAAYGNTSLEQILLDIGLRTDLTAEMLFQPRKIIELIDISGKVLSSTLDAFVCAVHPSRPLLLLTDCFRSQSTIAALMAKQTLKKLMISLQKRDVWDLSMNKIHQDDFKNMNLNQMKKLILDGCGLNVLPNIQAKALVSLKATRNQIQELSLNKSYQKIKDIDLSENKIRYISFVDGLFSIQVLNLSNNRLKSVSLRELSRLPYLSELLLQQNQISQFEFDQNDCPSLQTLLLDNNKINKLDFLNGKLNYLQNLSFANNSLQQVDLSSRPSLKQISLNNNLLLVFLAFNDFRNLHSISAGKLENNEACCSIKTIQLNALPALTTLVINSNELLSLDVRDLPALRILDASDNKIQELLLGSSPLQQLKLSYNYLSELNLSPLGKALKLKLIMANFNLLQRIKIDPQATFPFLEFVELKYNLRMVPLSQFAFELERFPSLSYFLTGHNTDSFDYCWWCLRNSNAEINTEDETLNELMKGYEAINKAKIPEKKRKLVMIKTPIAERPSKVLDLLKFKDHLGDEGIFSDDFDQILSSLTSQ